MPYHLAYKSLENIYLEDSYVLNISEEGHTVLFEMEFVLTEQHSSFRPPEKNEQYCYKLGWLKFSGCSSKHLQLSNQSKSIDANGDIDLGNIDAFVRTAEKFSLHGCWGRFEAVCDEVSVEFDNRGDAS